MAQVANKCDGCKKRNSTWWCDECRKEYCKTCCQIHDGFPAHKKHTIVNNEDVCKDHNYEHSHFCTTCECFVCKECVFWKHKQHEIAKIRKVASHYREKALEIGTGVVETLESISKLKVSMQSEQENSLSPIKQFKENAKNCANKVKLIVKTVLDEYIAMTTEFQNNDEDAYKETLKRVKIFEDTQRASLSKLKKVFDEKHNILFITLFLKIKENFQEQVTIPCPPKRMELVPFNLNGMVSTVVERITSEFKTKEQQYSSEQMVDEMKTLHEENQTLLQDNEKLRKDIESLVKDKKGTEKLTKILQEKEEELNSMNQKCTDQEKSIQRLSKEREHLANRLPSMNAAKLNLKSHVIEDLSDTTRPIQLAERFTSIYDNEWSDVLDKLMETSKIAEVVAIKELIHVLQAINTQCKDQIKRRWQAIIKIIGYPEDYLEDYKERQYTSGKVDPTVEIVKDLVKSSTNLICEEIVQEIKKSSEVEEILRKGGNESDSFVTKCSHLCLLMAVRDPPPVFDFNFKPGDRFNTDLLRSYVYAGAVVEYLVWPAMYLSQGGPLMTKGVAMGKKETKGNQKKKN